MKMVMLFPALLWQNRLKLRAFSNMRMDRRNLLTKLFMNLGVDEETATEDACRIEHYISEKTFSALKAHISKHGS